MKFVLRTFDEILKGTTSNDGLIHNQDGFNNTKDKLSGKHNKKKTDILDQPRRHQVQFVEKSIVLTATEEDKAKILTSLILLLMCVIGRSYSPSILKLTDSENIYQALGENSATRKGYLGTGSCYFNSLMVNIGYSETNQFEPEDIVELLKIAKNFIESKIYTDGDSRKGAILDHPYAEIEQLDIFSYLTTAVLEIYESDVKIIERNKQTHGADLLEREKLKQEEQKKILEAEQALKGPGFFGNLFSFIKNEGKVGEIETDTLNKDNYMESVEGKEVIHEDNLLGSSSNSF